MFLGSWRWSQFALVLAVIDSSSFNPRADTQKQTTTLSHIHNFEQSRIAKKTESSMRKETRDVPVPFFYPIPNQIP